MSAKHLERLRLAMAECHRAYQDYMAGGKTLGFARVIKQRNVDVLASAIDAMEAADGAQRDDLEALVRHVKSWTAQWDEFYDSRDNWSDADAFVFQTRVPFPRTEMDRLFGA